MISISTNERLLILEVWEYLRSIETKVIMAMTQATLDAKNHQLHRDKPMQAEQKRAQWGRGGGFRMPR